MRIKLEKPMIALDTETTGLDICNDEIIELSLHKLFPDGREEIKNYRFNPDCPIKEDAFNVHGITEEELKDCPKFREKAEEIFEFLRECDIAGFSLRMLDLPLLAEHFLSCNIIFDLKGINIVDAGVIFKKKEERTLVAAVKFYLDREHIGAHGADADTVATKEVLFAQIEKYRDIGNSIEEIAKYSTFDNNAADFAGKLVYDAEGNMRFNFGKYKGQPVLEFPEYADWMIGTNFPRYTKHILRAYLSGPSKNYNSFPEENHISEPDDEFPF
jgi:DNA polymerase-3 subunit epsilon